VLPQMRAGGDAGALVTCGGGALCPGPGPGAHAATATTAAAENTASPTRFATIADVLPPSLPRGLVFSVRPTGEPYRSALNGTTPPGG
jgi:hypothetical protein